MISILNICLGISLKWLKIRRVLAKKFLFVGVRFPIWIPKRSGIFACRCLPSWFLDWDEQGSPSTFLSWTVWFAHCWAATLEITAVNSAFWGKIGFLWDCSRAEVHQRCSESRGENSHVVQAGMGSSWRGASNAPEIPDRSNFHWKNTYGH